MPQTCFGGDLSREVFASVLVMPGERVRILLRFTDYPGLFICHCHMLEHAGLTRNYLVQA